MFAKGIRGSIGKIVVEIVAQLVAFVRVVFVRKEFRGHGLGTILMQRAQSTLLANGFTTLQLDAEENINNHGRLIHMYENCGFVVTPGVRETFEYNDEECFRKVRMHCDLSLLTSLRPPQLPLEQQPVHKGFEFTQDMRREASELILRHPLSWTLVEALRQVEVGSPDAFRRALLSARLARQGGHADWMELAAGLRFLGRVQHLYSNWHTPYAVQVQLTSDERPGEDDGERLAEQQAVKMGPLPAWVCDDKSSTVVSPYRYPPGIGLDEVLLSWSDNEFSFLCLSRMGSAPHELAQLHRYCNYNEWLDSNVCVFQSPDEDHLLSLVLLYKQVLKRADNEVVDSFLNDSSIIHEEQCRRSFLIDKYFGQRFCVI